MCRGLLAVLCTLLIPCFSEMPSQQLAICHVVEEPLLAVFCLVKSGATMVMVACWGMRHGLYMQHWQRLQPGAAPAARCCWWSAADA
jgi:hypothetical protein